jgi:hypothetical protein
MIQTLLSDTESFSFFTVFAFRYSLLDKSYRRKFKQNVKKQIKQFSFHKNKLGNEQKARLNISNHNEKWLK